MEDAGENPERSGGSSSCDATVAYAELVSLPDVDVDGSPNGILGKPAPASQQAKSKAPSLFQAQACSDALVRQSLAEYQLCSESESIIMASWRPQTRKRYAPTIGKWHAFCVKENITPLHPPIGKIIKFLSVLYKKGGGY